jgi:ABC-type multidrug transport system ATPase subunit
MLKHFVAIFFKHNKFLILLIINNENCRTSGVGGTLLVNGEVRDESTFRKQSCYIMQNDNLQPLLTVHEAMTVAANLKLSAKNTHKEKQSKVIVTFSPQLSDTTNHLFPD